MSILHALSRVVKNRPVEQLSVHRRLPAHCFVQALQQTSGNRKSGDLLQRNPACFCRIGGGTQGARDNTGGKDDHYIVHLSLPIRAYDYILHIDKISNTNPKRSLLHDLSLQCLAHHLSRFHSPPGKRPQPQVWLASTANQQNAVFI